MPAEFTPALARASAIVTEMGGRLSQTSTLVRETDVMTVAGAKNADGGIADGEAVQAELRLLDDYKESRIVEFSYITAARKAGKVFGKQNTACDCDAPATPKRETLQ